MGGAVSQGRNNDDLIDNLLEASYIKTAQIERVFRAVDRAEYYEAAYRAEAYKDLAWRIPNLHLSAPCIYSEVMEALCLSPGLSFLNLGSGTGYLSTMVGLILGTTGINHGVECNEIAIKYAVNKLENFKRYSGAMDEYDFCEPKFIEGNCLRLSGEFAGSYDRVYCGAGCPEKYKDYMRGLIKVGGILVIPVNDRLLQIKRTSFKEWETRSVLPVSFASLVLPEEKDQNFIQPFEEDPLSLQILCRATIRNLLRKNIEIEHPPVKRPRPAKEPKRKRVLRRLVVPLFDDEDSSEEERHVILGAERNRNAGRAAFRREDDGIFSFFLGMGTRRGSSADRENLSSSRRNQDSNTNQESMETDTNASEENSNQSTSESSASHQVRAVIEHHPNPEGHNENNEEQEGNEQLDTINEISDVIVGCLEVLRRERTNFEQELLSDDQQDDEDEQEERNAEENQRTVTDTNPGTSNDVKRNGRREKFDSGLGDEIIEAQDSSEDEKQAKLDTISSCEEEQASGSEKRQKRGTHPISKYRRIESSQSSQDTSSENASSSEESKPIDNEMRMYQSPFTEHVKARIQELPLPTDLKKYLNYYRDF